MKSQANISASETLGLDYATNVARQVCARVFRDGGTPADALNAYGLAHEDVHQNWCSAVNMIATALCGHQRHDVGNVTALREAA